MKPAVSLWAPLPRVFDRSCAEYAQQVALVERERSLTYTAMYARSNQVANGLQALGVAKGERVALLLPNCLEFVPTQQGIWKCGAVQVQMPPRAGVADLSLFLRSSGATTLIYHQQFDSTVARLLDEQATLRRRIRLGDAPLGSQAIDYGQAFDGQPDSPPPVAVQPDDLAFITFTSGSTGAPKGVLQSHETWSHYVITAGMEIGDTRPGEVFAHGAPLTHFTQAFVLPTFMRGGTNVMLPSLDVDKLIDAIARHRVTATALVPTVVYLLLDHPRRDELDLSCLRTVIYAGSPMAPERLREALDVFGQIFVQTYAGTEPGFISVLRKEEHRTDTSEWRARLASAGRPMYHVDVTAQDGDIILGPGQVGEICARQAGRMVGYLDSTADADTIRGGWVHSGDVGYLDDAGYLYIVDRKKDMIVTGGLNVFPRQVEDVLSEHPAVAQCAVIGVPDPKWGEAVKAVVVLHEDHQATGEELIAWVKERKGSVSAPKTVDFVCVLPVNASGKVDKKQLRAPYWAGQTRNVS